MISPSALVNLLLNERLKCMETLWESLRSSQPESPEWHGRVLSERLAKIERGEAKFILGAELKS